LCPRRMAQASPRQLMPRGQEASSPGVSPGRFPPTYSTATSAGSSRQDDTEDWWRGCGFWNGQGGRCADTLFAIAAGCPFATAIRLRSSLHRVLGTKP
jgi:hypothetical protein